VIQRTLGVAILLAGTATFALATIQTPEIDPGSAAAALALLSGGVLVLRGRRKKS
jgi:LPXTG-motif cell wall-anchored protein